MTDKQNTMQNKKDFIYASQTQTDILLEEPSDNNPYVSKANYLHGYNVVDLVEKKSFIDTLLLLFTGNLPTKPQAQLLERLMIALMNLGPRHPAVKASMVAGVSKTNAEHLLPIGLTVLGGKDNGALEVANCIDFLNKHINTSPHILAAQLLSDYQSNLNQEIEQGEAHLCPGFGNQYGGFDEFTFSIAQSVLLPFMAAKPVDCAYIKWALNFAEQLQCQNMGVLKTGLVAIVCCQLGIASREAIGLFQLMCAPGIFAHGVEQTHKPITAMPILSDEQHIYNPEAHVNNQHD